MNLLTGSRITNIALLLLLAYALTQIFTGAYGILLSKWRKESKDLVKKYGRTMMQGFLWLVFVLIVYTCLQIIAYYFFGPVFLLPPTPRPAY